MKSRFSRRSDDLNARRSRRRRGREAGLLAESLEKRQLLAVTAYAEPTLNGGWTTVVAEPGDSVFVQQVASVPQSLYVADNSSFLNRTVVGGPVVRGNTSVAGQIATGYDINSLNTLSIVSGTQRSDFNVEAVGYPMTSPSTTRFTLESDGLDLGYYYSGSHRLEGTISLVEPDGTPQTWQFSNSRYDSFSGTTYYEGLPTLRTGIGVDQPATTGSYYPTKIQPIGYSFQSYLNPLGRSKSEIEVTWNVPQIPSSPKIDTITWWRGFSYAASDFNELTQKDILPSAPAQFRIDLPSSTGPGLNPIIPSTFSATIAVDDQVFSVKTGGGTDKTLWFWDDGRWKTTANWRKSSGDNFSEYTISGTFKTGEYDFFNTTGDPYFRGLSLQMSGDFKASLQRADYAVSASGLPVAATIFAGLDITNALDVNLLSPGSSFSLDSPVRVASGRTIDGLTGIDVRATTVNFNAQASTNGAFGVGGGSIDQSQSLLTATAVAQIQNGKVVRLVVPPGLSGAGYDPDSPPLVTVAPPQSLQATASLLSLTNGRVASIKVTAGGSGYTAAPTVTIAGPTAGSGQRATATATIGGSAVSAVDVVAGGSGYSNPPTVTFLANAGSGASATASIVGSIGTVQILNGGSGYTPNLNSGNNRDPKYVVTFKSTGADSVTPAKGYIQTDGNGTVFAIDVVDPGAGYTLDSTQIILPAPPPIANPKTATVTAVVDRATGRITGFNVVDGGSGYGAIPSVTIAPPTATSSASQPVASINAGQVTRITRGDSAGYGYTTAPVVSLSRPFTADGRQATAHATIDNLGRVTGIVVDDPGTGYTQAPVVTIGQANPRSRAETVRFNAGVGASVFSLLLEDDPATPDVGRSTLLVSSSGSLGGDVFGNTPTGSVLIESHKGDVLIAGTINATTQSYLLQSDPQDQGLAPFLFSTIASSGVQTGRIIGNTLAVTLAHDLDTPLAGAAALSEVSLRTKVDSLRIRAATDNKGDDAANPYPYRLAIDEADNIQIDAVAASSFPIVLTAAGNMNFTAALATAGGLEIGGVDRFDLSAPVSTTKGQIIVSANAINVKNSLQVTDAAPDENHADIILSANSGNIGLTGGLVAAVNRVVINQKNRTGSTARSYALNNTATVGDGQTTLLPITVSDDFTFTNIRVAFDAISLFNRDLAAVLIAPDGKEFPLFAVGQLRGSNLSGTVFDSNATTLIAAGAPPYVGDFKPPDPGLAALYGRSARGTWTLRVLNIGESFGSNPTTVNGFSLTFTDPASQGSTAAAVVGTSRIVADTLEIESQGSVGDPAVLPGDPTFHIRTNVNRLQAQVAGSIAIDETDELDVVSLRAGGLVTLRANGVDPQIDEGGNVVVAALHAALTDVKQLDVSAPRGSVDVVVNTPGPILVGNTTALALSNAARAGKVFPMQAAGSVSIRSLGGSTGGNLVLFDAPIAGASAIPVRFAATASLENVSYDPRVAGIYASTLTATRNGPLDAILGPQPKGVYSTAASPQAIPDNSPKSPATMQIVVGDDFTIADINVTIEITHKSLRDLSATLVAPDGKTEIPLFLRNQLKGSNIAGTTFDAEALRPITGGTAPYRGSFRPVPSATSLASLTNTSAKGTWTLKVTDWSRRDAGTLDRFELSFGAKPNADMARAGDRVLVAGGIKTGPWGTEANGIYTVVDPGSPTTPWKLVRSFDADTGRELPAHSIVGVSDGLAAAKFYRLDHTVKEEEPFGFDPRSTSRRSP